MKIYYYCFLVISWMIVLGLSVYADDLAELQQLNEPGEELSVDSLESLGESSLAELEGTGENMDDDFDALTDESDQELADDSSASYAVNGYLKTMINWNRTVYSKELWAQYQQLDAYGYSVPEDQIDEGYTYAGIRAQLSLEAYLGERARLFSGFNLDYNAAEEIDADGYESTSEQNEESQQGSLRIVEAFIELYEGSRTWKVGTQLVTWSFLEGFETPTDRLNARDNTYVSSEYEDTKLPSSGIIIKQEIGDSALEIAYIPVGKVNINPSFTDYLFPGGQQSRETVAENSKWATRLIGSIYKLDVALSYVDGTDLQADTVLLDSNDNEMQYDPASSTQQLLIDMATYNRAARVYNRVRSSGLDLQLNLGSWIPKASLVHYLTEDEDGEDPFVKNNWSQYLLGGEFKIGSATVNLYAGQQIIENYREYTPLDLKTNFLNNQRRERTDMVSGYIDADFLTGNALKLNLMFAGYWDDEGEPAESKFKAYLKYKIDNGLDIYFAVSHVDIETTQLTDFQAEIKYSL